MMSQALNDLADAFALVAPISMALERIETAPRFAAIADPTTATAVCTFGLEVDGRGGRFTLLMPHTMMEPVREKLQQRFLGARSGGDAGWGEQLERELRRAVLTVTATLSEQQMPLHAVRGWKVGDVVPLGIGADDEVSVRVEGRPLSAGLIGRRHAQTAVRLTRQWEGALR